MSGTQFLHALKSALIGSLVLGWLSVEHVPDWAGAIWIFTAGWWLFKSITASGGE